MSPIEQHCLSYAKWLIANHPGPRWALKNALRANLARWREAYGDKVADYVREHIKEAWNRLKADASKEAR